MPCRLRTWVLVSASFALVTPGCVTTNNGKTESRPHLGSQRQPEGVSAGSLFVAAEYPVDTDANGYVDTINVTAYLFDGSGKTTLAVFVPGEFEFTLMDARGTSVATWRIDQTRAEAAVQLMQAGPGYRFRLSLLELGTDKLETPSVVLMCAFKPPTGNTVRSTGGTSFRLGRAQR